MILVVGLVVLGPTRLPQTARQVGQALGELRRVSSGFQAELHQALHEAPAPTPAGPNRSRRPEPLRARPVEATNDSAA